MFICFPDHAFSILHFYDSPQLAMIISSAFLLSSFFCFASLILILSPPLLFFLFLLRLHSIWRLFPFVWFCLFFLYLIANPFYLFIYLFIFYFSYSYTSFLSIIFLYTPVLKGKNSICKKWWEFLQLCNYFQI